MADLTTPAADPENEGVADDQDSDEAILKASREGLAVCIEEEADLRDKMKDDLRFATLDQWPADIRAARENDAVNGARPCLTVDQINQFLTQVGNDLARNKRAIKVLPVDDVGDPETAKIFQGLARYIEDRSSAQIAYQTCGDSAVTVGLGYCRLVTDFVSSDSFDQEIIIKRVPDTFSVYLARHNMPDGSDSDAGWVFETVSLEKFKGDYPEASTKDDDFAGLGTDFAWKTDKTIVVCEYFYKRYEDGELLSLADGSEMDKDDYDAIADPRPGIIKTRKTQKCSVKWVKHTGAEILERTDWLGKYIPIAEMIGKEKFVDGKRVLWGLVRPAKDSLRAFNYWISAMVEVMALAPKAPWLGAVGQFTTAGDKFDLSNVNNYAKLEYDPIDVNGNALPPPRRNEPVPLQAAMMQTLGIMQNNIKSSLGMYKAAIGDSESQQSGRAILALQHESDTGTMHFGDNQGLMITHMGRMIVDLAPKVYDKPRLLQILGEDGKAGTARIDPQQQESMREYRDNDGVLQRVYNLNVGTFDVTTSAGPGYQTSRQEAATVMTDLANTAKDPISAAILRYGAVKNSDFFGSEEITKMLKAMLPPQLQQTEGEQQPIPPQVQQMMAQAKQHLEALAAENQQLKSGAQEAQAKIAADHDAKMKALALEEKVQIERARLEDEKAMAEINRKRWVAEQEIAIKRQAEQDDAQLAQREMEHKANCERLDSITEMIKGMHAASQVSAKAASVSPRT